jgi:TRAP-type C4-dicarboxylate transport system substrate-binding protein
MSFPQLNMLDRVAKATQRFIMIFCSAVIVLIVGTAALLRYLFGADLYGAEEFLTIAAFWMYFMSAVYATHTRSHISAEVFSAFCKSVLLRRAVHFFQLGVTVTLAVLYSYWGWYFFYWSLTEGGKSTVWQIPLVVAHSAVFLGFVLMAWYFILQLIGDITDLLRVKIRIASQYSPDHMATGNLTRLKQQIEQASDRKIRIQVCPNSELGDYTKVHEGLNQGIIGMALISVPSQLDHRLGALYLPYLATSYAEARNMYGRGAPLFQEADRVHRDLGIKFLGFNMEGFGGIGLRRLPAQLHDPAAAKGLSLRVPPMEVFKTTAKEQGFDPVTVPFNEVDNILDTDEIDGIAGCPPHTTYLHFRKHIKHFLVCYGFVETTSYLMSQTLWESLSGKQQMLIQTRIDALSAESFSKAEEVELDYLDRLRKANIEVTSLSGEELAKWVNHARTVIWPKFYPSLSPEPVEIMKAQAATQVPGRPVDGGDAASHHAANSTGRK